MRQTKISTPVPICDFETMRTYVAHTIERHVETEQDYQSPVPGLTLFRRDKPQPPASCFVETSIVVAVQGEKQMLSADKAYPYNAKQFLLTSLDMPVSSQVLKASPEMPCLGITFRLNMRIMAEIMARGVIQVPRDYPVENYASINRGTVTCDLLDTFMRLVNLLDTPDYIPFMTPLIEYEIHFRLLQSDMGWYLMQNASVGSKERRIAKAIEWLKENYRQELHINTLTEHAQMSKSSLYQHFRNLTGMTPLQYQKWLRLTEAKRLMLTEGINAASAAFRVGYQSPSHFSREYNALFGAPPKRDVADLRSKFEGQRV